MVVTPSINWDCRAPSVMSVDGLYTIERVLIIVTHDMGTLI
ncbi:hypothetical protein [Nocardia abscessus]|nr:hypothetical protein [Nocardia abscessus]